MNTYQFKGLLQRSGWLTDVSIEVDEDGIIQKIQNEIDPDLDTINGYALPGFQNAHSHAFQYAMAGLAEKSNVNTSDDFWGWREAMYRLALTMDPDQMEAIASMLYAEMARHGYTNVAEFHYVHHDKNGKPYENIAEMGNRLIAAAQSAGIGITLIPIFYQKGGFGKEPGKQQRRFISKTVDDYLKLIDASLASCAYYELANVGLGIHSMRGVEPTDIVVVANSFQKDLPFHIHISEQLKEVEDSLDYLNQRPVEWLMNNVALNDRFHLVHATHLTEEETEGLAKSKANVVLCPSTEGNLGDGIFPLKAFQRHGGRWSIGTDSHVGINPLEELRILDYGQRLISHQRSTFFDNDVLDSGTYSLEMVTTTGRKAMNNFNEEYFKIGEPLNALVIDADAPLIESSSLDQLTSTIVYTSDASMHLATISHGELITKSGKHIHGETITKRFKEVMKELNNR